MNILDRRDRAGFVSNLSAAVLSVLLMNGIIAAINPTEMSSARPVPLAPPGYVIGLVWVVLFACLGTARWIVLSSPRGSSRAANPILYLFLFCLAYPLYTGGLRSLALGLLGNLATIFFACFVVARAARISPVAAALVAPIIAWVSFATLLVVQQIWS